MFLFNWHIKNDISQWCNKTKLKSSDFGYNDWYGHVQTDYCEFQGWFKRWKWDRDLSQFSCLNSQQPSLLNMLVKQGSVKWISIKIILHIEIQLNDAAGSIEMMFSWLYTQGFILIQNGCWGVGFDNLICLFQGIIHIFHAVFSLTWPLECQTRLVSKVIIASLDILVIAALKTKNDPCQTFNSQLSMVILVSMAPCIMRLVPRTNREWEYNQWEIALLIRDYMFITKTG